MKTCVPPARYKILTEGSKVLFLISTKYLVLIKFAKQDIPQSHSEVRYLTFHFHHILYLKIYNSNFNDIWVTYSFPHLIKGRDQIVWQIPKINCTLLLVESKKADLTTGKIVLNMSDHIRGNL